MKKETSIHHDTSTDANTVLADALSNDVNWLKVNERCGATHHIEKVMGTEVDLTKLKDNQSVCWGDGETYHFRLTEKRIG